MAFSDHSFHYQAETTVLTILGKRKAIPGNPLENTELKHYTEIGEPEPAPPAPSKKKDRAHKTQVVIKVSEDSKELAGPKCRMGDLEIIVLDYKTDRDLDLIFREVMDAIDNADDAAADPYGSEVWDTFLIHNELAEVTRDAEDRELINTRTMPIRFLEKPAP